MQYKCELDITSNILTVTIIGNLTREKAVLYGLSICKKATKDNCKLIFDFRLACNKICLGDAYFGIQDLYSIKNLDIKKIPTAHIPNEKDIEFFKFVETVAINRFVNVKMCRSIPEAKYWLEQF